MRSSFEAPTRQYRAAQRAGTGLDPERHGIAVALGSPPRKRITTALLEMVADSSLDALRNRRFRQAP